MHICAKFKNGFPAEDKIESVALHANERILKIKLEKVLEVKQ